MERSLERGHARTQVGVGMRRALGPRRSKGPGLDLEKFKINLVSNSKVPEGRDQDLADSPQYTAQPS